MITETFIQYCHFLGYEIIPLRRGFLIKKIGG